MTTAASPAPETGGEGTARWPRWRPRPTPAPETGGGHRALATAAATTSSRSGDGRRQTGYRRAAATAPAVVSPPPPSEVGESAFRVGRAEAPQGRRRGHDGPLLALNKKIQFYVRGL